VVRVKSRSYAWGLSRGTLQINVHRTEVSLSGDATLATFSTADGDDICQGQHNLLARRAGWRTRKLRTYMDLLCRAVHMSYGIVVAPLRIVSFSPARPIEHS